MKPDVFQSKAAGQVVRVHDRDYWAFVPHPLPPVLPLTWALTALLSEADRVLGELSGAGHLLINPHLLIAPYIRREAVLSSQIEGTETDMSDLLLFEAEPEEPPRTPDVNEVRNYIAAMDYGLKRVRELPLSGRLARELHEKLMRGVRGDHAAPGEFRYTQNWIGEPGCTLNEATFVPPPPEEMKLALGAWEKYLHGNPAEPPLVQCALMHYQFEAIHPFLDGNGRVGRLLITLFLCERGILSQPLLYLSAFFERHRDEYYRRLLAVSQEGEWEGWLTFFLRGVREQARDAYASARQLLDLHAAYRQRIEGKRVPHAAVRLVDHLFENPIVSIAHLSKVWGINYPTMQKGVEYLVNKGILEEITGQPRNRLYIAHELHDLLAKPYSRRRPEDGSTP